MYKGDVTGIAYMSNKIGMFGNLVSKDDFEHRKKQKSPLKGQ